jgi:hypothetical protein
MCVCVCVCARVRVFVCVCVFMHVFRCVCLHHAGPAGGQEALGVGLVGNADRRVAGEEGGEERTAQNDWA